MSRARLTTRQSRLARLQADSISQMWRPWGPTLGCLLTAGSCTAYSQSRFSGDFNSMLLHRVARLLLQMSCRCESSWDRRRRVHKPAELKWPLCSGCWTWNRKLLWASLGCWQRNAQRLRRPQMSSAPWQRLRGGGRNLTPMLREESEILCKNRCTSLSKVQRLGEQAVKDCHDALPICLTMSVARNIGCFCQHLCWWLATASCNYGCMQSTCNQNFVLPAPVCNVHVTISIAILFVQVREKNAAASRAMQGLLSAATGTPQQ
jgi:hypothetical protein